MTWWFCTTHRRAGVAHDRPCCQTTAPVACETDAQLWYRIRMAMKPRRVHDEVFDLRTNPRAMRDVLARHAVARGKTFTVGDAPR